MRSKRPNAESRTTATASPARQIARFIATFEPRIATTIRACRSALRKRLPTAVEMIYDNYNFLAIGFGTTDRTSDCIVSLACSAKGVALSFYWGATLPDPNGILLGAGNQNRFVRLESPATLREPAVAALIDAAVAQADPPLPKSGRGSTLIKSVAAQQRPRRTDIAPAKKRRRGAIARGRQMVPSPGVKRKKAKTTEF